MLSVFFKINIGMLVVSFLCGLTSNAQQIGSVINPGGIWLDNQGNHIQAHGGGIIKVKGIYYWYGEQRRQGLDTNYRYVSCYSSKDMINWSFKGDVLQITKPDTILGKWMVERPKVFFNKRSQKFIMYMHVDGQVKGVVPNIKVTGSYTYARVGTAISDKATGPFQFIRTFRPLNHESRDIGQFIDDDGAAYLVFEDRPYGFRIAKLSDDYLNVEKEICLIPEHMEGGAIVQYKGLYYAIGSALTGWGANPNKYATSKSLSGPWSEFKDIAPREINTYGSQSTMIIKVVGSKNTTVIFMGDIWKPKTQWDSRYLWMPLKIGDGKLWLPKPEPWKLNIKTGENSVLTDTK